MKIKIVALLILLCTATLTSFAQKRNASMVTVTATVSDTEGTPVGGAVVTAGEGSTVVRTDRAGRFSVSARTGSSILIEAEGFEPATCTARGGESTATLEKAPAMAGSSDRRELPMLLSEKPRYTVGAISAAPGSEFAHYTSSYYTDVLQGKLMGLYATMNAGGGSSLYIRGHHRDSGNGIVAIVDGVERSVDDLTLEDVQTVEVLKDATAKIMYGARAANGILLVTTRRGKAGTRTVDVSVESGAGLPEKYGSFLGSYDYARLYNEARANDGFAPLYTPADLEGYRNSTGENDLRYPDVDYYDRFLRSRTNFNRASVVFSGGNESARYAMVAGYTGERGLTNTGESPQENRFNIRGNLDVKVTDFMSAFMGLSGVFDVTKSSNLSNEQFFTALSTHRPNEYPLILPSDAVKSDSLGIPGLGASMAVADNLYGMLQYGGKRKDQNIYGKLNLGLRFNLDAITEGLYAQGCVTFDNYFYGRESLTTSAATYARRWEWNGTEDVLVLIPRKRTEITDKQTLSNSYNLRTNAFIGTFGYGTTFQGTRHRLSAELNYFAYKAEATGDQQDTKTANTSLRVNYTFRDKYVVEGDGALMQSGKFKGSGRNFLAWAAGAGWILSEEGFLHGSRTIDYLKLKASAGVLGYDAAAPWFSYDNRWNDNGTARINNAENPAKTTFEQAANPSLGWEKSREVNVGIEALLNRRLWVEANWFDELRYDMIQKVDALYSAAYGGLYPYINWGRIRNYGMEAELRWSASAGKWFYRIGVTGVWSMNKVLRASQITYGDEYRRQEGRSSDAIFGYVSQGLFGRDVPLAGHAHQTLGAYGAGDIAYADLNGDNRVDDLDRKQIGYSFPRAQLGLDASLSWKGFGLYVLLTSQLGGHVIQNNAYRWNYGEGKYSTLALDRYHPANNPQGSYPRLTTTDGTNNFTASDFWLESTDFLRLKNAEVSYTFGYDRPLPVIKKIKLYVRGANLLTLSKIRDADPEALNAGLTACPILKMVTGGVALTF